MYPTWLRGCSGTAQRTCTTVKASAYNLTARGDARPYRTSSTHHRASNFLRVCAWGGRHDIRARSTAVVYSPSLRREGRTTTLYNHDARRTAAVCRTCQACLRGGGGAARRTSTKYSRSVSNLIARLGWDGTTYEDNGQQQCMQRDCERGGQYHTVRPRQSRGRGSASSLFVRRLCVGGGRNHVRRRRTITTHKEGSGASNLSVRCCGCVGGGRHDVRARITAVLYPT